MTDGDELSGLPVRAVPDRGARLLRCVSGAASAGPEGALRHVVHLPPRAATTAPWPAWTPDPVRAALAARGVSTPWSHQVEAAQLAHAGRDVIVATGTASGKSLAYQLPVLADLVADPLATALYLAPTKALAADQL
ncbi:MAG: DEAD/DEAH box helicase, partial [Pseudonocardia sp.]|nr:DEAD/DEAH box helicase [Pseudonocardia sp.]